MFSYAASVIILVNLFLGLLMPKEVAESESVSVVSWKIVHQFLIPRGLSIGSQQGAFEGGFLEKYQENKFGSIL